MAKLNKLNPKLVCTYSAPSVPKENYVNNRETLLEKSKNYYKANTEQRKQYARIYAKENKASLNIKWNLKQKKIKQATPPWVSKEQLKHIYENVPATFEVDHIIPINNNIVCGLNVPWNLQYLSKKDNATKSNSFDGTKNNDGWKKKNGD